MRNRAKQRENRRLYGKSNREKLLDYRNSEHYADPTAYKAVRNIVKEQNCRAMVNG